MSENNEKKSGGQYIEINGNKVRYFEEGNGPTVLFIHGIGQAMYTFRKNVRIISEYCHVVTIDLLGHGLSDKPEIDYTLDDFSQLIYDFMEAMGIDNAALAGFSTGGIIALDVAIKHPEKVSRLILFSPGGITKTYPTKIRQLSTPIISDLLFTFFNKNMIKSVLETAYYDPESLSGDIVRHYYKVLSDKDNLDSFIVAVSNWNDSSVAYDLQSVKAPCYIFWGENDTWHPLSALELYEDALPEVFSMTVPQCGHMVHEEAADEINRKLIDIMKHID